MRALALVPVVLLAGCPDGPGAARDMSEDLSFNAYGTCEPLKITGGTCEVREIGQTYRCSTWEHDLCCACLPAAGGARWVCQGPHVYECTPDLGPGG